MVPTSAAKTVTQRHVLPPISCFLLLALSLLACPKKLKMDSIESTETICWSVHLSLCRASFVLCCQVSDLDSEEAISPAMTQIDALLHIVGCHSGLYTKPTAARLCSL